MEMIIRGKCDHLCESGNLWKISRTILQKISYHYKSSKQLRIYLQHFSRAFTALVDYGSVYLIIICTHACFHWYFGDISTTEKFPEIFPNVKFPENLQP